MPFGGFMASERLISHYFIVTIMKNDLESRLDGASSKRDDFYNKLLDKKPQTRVYSAKIDVPYGNYHNHTTMSDGDLTPEKLAEEAIKAGLKEIGITDHYFTKKLPEKNVITQDKMQSYLATIDKLRKKYSEKINILAGLEIDARKWNFELKDLPFEKFNKMDYVLFEYVDEEADSYSLKDIAGIRKNLKCEVGLAHSKVGRLIDKYGAEKLVQTLVDNNIFIDACGSVRNSHLMPYTSEDRPDVQRAYSLYIEGLGANFKEAARKYHLKFAPSSDTHRNNSTDNLANAGNASRTIKDYGFTPQKFPKK
jgi:hypothetical protein